MTMPCPPCSIPVYSSFEPRQPGEQSISTAKTAVSKDGRSVTIIEDSDGNEPFLNKTYPIVRFEFDGGKVIFQADNRIPCPDERSIDASKTKALSFEDHHYIQIIDGSDGNEEFLNLVFRIVRYEGSKVIFKPD